MGQKFFLYTDDTSIIVTNPEYDDYKLTMTRIFFEVNTWFRINLLKLNVNFALEDFVKLTYREE
jgi:hypothetical protein